MKSIAEKMKENQQRPNSRLSQGDTKQGFGGGGGSYGGSGGSYGGGSSSNQGNGGSDN
jgi:hypothetical protein